MANTVTNMNLIKWIHNLKYERGTVESPAGSNCNPYSHALGRPCQRWCADFMVAMSISTGGIIIPGTSAYTPHLANSFKKTGTWHTTPEIGDWAFYDFNLDGVIQHVDGVIDVHPSFITTIGGNTSDSDGGSQDNGGGVFQRQRQRNSQIVGYGRPVYVESITPIPPTPSEDDEMVPKCMHWKGAIFLVGYDQVTGHPWRRTFANPDRLAQVVEGGAARLRADGNAFEVTNNQFMTVYQDLGPA